MPRRRFHPTLPALLVTLLVVSLGVRLGVWQLTRAEEKRVWLAQIETRATTPQSLEALLAMDDPAHYPIRLQGEFDNTRNILLDNRIHQGRAGYHVLTPFRSQGQWVLVNRGWIPGSASRDTLPTVTPATGDVIVQGHTYLYSSKTFTLAEDDYDRPAVWPLRVQKVEMQALGEVLGVELAPFEIRVAENARLDSEADFIRDWQDDVSGPERHQAYALQWFLLAAAALVVFIAASLRKTDDGYVERHDDTQ